MTDKPETIPAPVRDLVDTFEDRLAEVKFPGIDHGVLADATERVTTAALELERAKSQLAAAEATLADSQAQLLAKCEQALAYAKVYAAATDPGLMTRLNSIALARRPAGKKPAKAKPRAAGDAKPGAVKKTRKREMTSELPGGDGAAQPDAQPELLA